MYSIIIPAYNEQKTIKKVILNVQEALKKLDYELLVVNDGSSDNTQEIVKSMKGVRLINHVHNKGYGAALKTGAKEAKGEYVIYMDADGQHFPEDIHKLIGKSDGVEMVVGMRTAQMSIIRAPAKILLGMMANYLAERKIPDLNSGFRLIKRDFVLKYLKILPNTFSFTTTITLALMKEGCSVVYTPIRIRKRAGGTSTIHPIKDTMRFAILMLRITMLFSPLRVFLPISAGLFVLAIGMLVYEIIRFFDLGSLSVLLFVSSLLIFCVGLLADQVSQLRRSQ